jgi:hypothetical protein
MPNIAANLRDAASATRVSPYTTWPRYDIRGCTQVHFPTYRKKDSRPSHWVNLQLGTRSGAFGAGPRPYQSSRNGVSNTHCMISSAYTANEISSRCQQAHGLVAMSPCRPVSTSPAVHVALRTAVLIHVAPHSLTSPCFVTTLNITCFTSFTPCPLHSLAFPPHSHRRLEFPAVSWLVERQTVCTAC